MLYCDKCGVSITGNPDFCPLCQGELSGTAEGGSKYPAIKQKPDLFRFALRIWGIVTVTAVCICAVINYSISGRIAGWWLYVAGSTASFWLSLLVALKRRRNIAKSIFFTTFVATVLAVCWDLFTGYKGWSLNFVLPIASCAAMLAMAVIAWILKLQIEQYIYYLILDIIFGIVPLVLLFCGAITLVPLSLACVAVSIISLAALLIFQGKALRAEIVRRTHL